MGLFDRFGKASKTSRHVSRLTNAYAQTQDRTRAMEILAGMGTPEAFTGLLQRFTFRIEASIVDNDEKEYACQLLIDAGPKAIEPIKAFVESNDAVYWPLRALRDIAGTDAAVGLLLNALDRSLTKEGRQNEQKVQLVANLRDFKHPKVEARLLELVHDRDEEVRILAIDALMTYGPETALEPAVQRAIDPDESLRVKTVVIEQLIENAWPLTPWREQLAADDALPVPYALGAGDRIIRET
ncbi:MAG: HEAT repeat domain-containing protein [Deltaproteobacteria bacterium]|nr:HEAT repeat domain-containing protein [Deltaproteobacteria bacterium]MCB9786458.1 HEAT repeat domain-containing protein [Deltaproteobacteria bacterium]